MNRPDSQRRALERIAADNPGLAARLVLMTLPAASAGIRKPLAYDLTVDEIGTRRVLVAGGRTRVEQPGDNGKVDFRMTTDARTLVEIVTGVSEASGARRSSCGRWRRRTFRWPMSCAPAAGSTRTPYTARCPT